MKKENIYILLILIGLMLFLPSAGHCNNTIEARHKIIVIDPGHGGTDTGIVTKTGHTEKDISFMLTGFLAKLLDTQYSVYLTRQEDIFMDDVSRTSFANNHRADLFISIHIGNSPDNVSRFFFYMPAEEQVSVITPDDHTWQHQALKHNRVSRQLCDILLKTFARHDGQIPGFVSGAPVKLLSGCQMPAVAIEPFSLKSVSGASSKSLEEILKIYAELIKNGIDSFFTEN